MDGCQEEGTFDVHSVFGVEPGDRRHIRLFARAEFDQVGSSIGVDDQVGLDGRPCRLDHDMDAPGIAVSAFGITDDPTHSVAGGQWSGTDQLFARLKRDIRDLPWRSIDLVERTGAIGKHLDGVEIPGAPRLNARNVVCNLDAIGRGPCLCLALVAATGRSPSWRDMQRFRAAIVRGHR